MLLLLTVLLHNASLAFTMRYRLMVTGVSSRLDQITVLLRDRFMARKIIQFKGPAMTNEERDIKSIKEIGHIYEILCEIMDGINLVHSFTVWKLLLWMGILKEKYQWTNRFQIMMRTGVTFVSSVFLFYSLYELLIAGDESMQSLVILHFNWVSIFIFNTLVVIHNGSQVAGKVTVQYDFVYYFDRHQNRILFFRFTEQKCDGNDS